MRRPRFLPLKPPGPTRPVPGLRLEGVAQGELALVHFPEDGHHKRDFYDRGAEVGLVRVYPVAPTPVQVLYVHPGRPLVSGGVLLDLSPRLFEPLIDPLAFVFGHLVRDGLRCRWLGCLDGGQGALLHGLRKEPRRSGGGWALRVYGVHEVFGHPLKHDLLVLRILWLVGPDRPPGRPQFSISLEEEHVGALVLWPLDVYGGPRRIELTPVDAPDGLGVHPRDLGGNGPVGDRLRRGVRLLRDGLRSGPVGAGGLFFPDGRRVLTPGYRGEVIPDSRRAARGVTYGEQGARKGDQQYHEHAKRAAPTPGLGEQPPRVVAGPWRAFAAAKPAPPPPRFDSFDHGIGLAPSRGGEAHRLSLFSRTRDSLSERLEGNRPRR